jgi:inorganic pyrophosphatase
MNASQSVFIIFKAFLRIVQNLTTFFQSFTDESKGVMDYWDALDALVQENGVVKERAKGQSHPRYPEYVYTVDYGYVRNTTAADGAGIDVFIGTEPDRGIVGILCTVDTLKRDAEVKILLGCSAEEIERALTLLKKGGLMSAIFVPRPSRGL